MSIKKLLNLFPSFRLFNTQRAWRLIPRNKRTEAFILFIMMILGMFLEMLGVGMVLPVITLVSRPELASDYPVIVGLFELLGNPDKTELMLWAMLLIVVIYSIKNLYLTVLAWKQSKFVYGTQAEMAKILFRGYLNQPYTFHLQRNSADLINNLQVELNLFMNYMLSPSMLVMAESLVVIGLVSLLFYFEPVGALSVFSLFFVVGGIYLRLTKRRIKHWGSLRQAHEALRMKHAQQGIGAIKDVKVSGTEDFFIEQYEINSEKSLSMHQRNSFLQNITRFWIELLAIAGLSMLSAGMYLQGKTVIEILPVLGLFGAVAFRLMPSLSRIISSLNLLRFGGAVTSNIEKEMQEIESPVSSVESAELNFNSSIELRNIEYRYPSAKKPALADLNIHIPKGEMLGFIGKSGAGKSTLIDIIMGLLEPTKGELWVDGVKIDKTVVKSWQQLIGYVPQFIYLTDDTLKRNIAFGLDDDEIDESAVQKALKAAQLQELVNDLPDGVDTLLGERGVRLSGGQRQRIGIARALYHDPDILVLDEATSALDADTEGQIMEAVYQLHGHKTLMVIAHRLSTLKNADRVFAIHDGCLVSSSGRQ